MTVRTPYLRIGGGVPVAYAICVPELPPFYAKRFESTSPVDRSSPRTVTAGKELDWEFPQMSGVGGEVTSVDSAPGPIPIVSDVFIDTLMPSVDLTSVAIQAVRRSPGSGASAGSAYGRVGGAPAAGPDDEDWSVTGYGVDGYYY